MLKDVLEINDLSDRDRRIWLNRVNQYAGCFLADNRDNTPINKNTLEKTFKDCVIPAPKFLYPLITEEIQRMKKE